MIKHEIQIATELDGSPMAYGYMIRSKSLRFCDDILYISREYAKNMKAPALKLNFSLAYLPPNKIYKTVQKLKDRPDLARVVVAVVDLYILRQRNSKSTADTALALASNVIRFLEYCWINNIFHLKNVTPSHWDDFLNKYVKGDWHLVLDLERRASSIDISTLRLSLRRQRRNAIEYSCLSLLEAIGTNIAESQVNFEYKISNNNGVLRRARGAAPLSESSITAVISHLNNLADIPKDMRTLSLAHQNPYIYASSVGEVSSRTRNFEPEKLAALMREAYLWVTVYAELILKLAGRVYRDMPQYEGRYLDEMRLIVLLEAPETKSLERLLGVSITNVRRVGDWHKIGLLGLLRVMLAASFILLCVFNGRRKDELQSPVFGLYSDGFECLDVNLGLYQAYFYCEKTTRDYQQFFINEISFKALSVLKAVSNLAWEHVVRNGGEHVDGHERKLFCMPARDNEHYPVWYDYSTDRGIDLLTERATSSKDPVVPNAHMFRRAYAVVFMYRYENEDLYALSQQLDHHDLGMTLHYVLEGPSRVFAHHAATLWGDGGATKKARAAHAASLVKEIEDYSSVKLHDDILEILIGEKIVAGKFPRLVQRFLRVMHGRIKYDDANLRDLANSVSKVLVGRGHTVRPFVHGNCNSGVAKSGAKCYREGRLARELASVIVCGNCPYHLMKRNHLRAVQDDLERQRRIIAIRSSDSLQSVAELHALRATENLIEFYLSKNIDDVPETVS